MLLTCPSCETRYQVEEAAIDRAAGRQVRCANCGYLWHFAPVLEEHVPDAAAAAPAARSAGGGAATAPAATPGAGPARPGSALPADPADPMSTTLELGSAAAPAVVGMHPALRGLLQVGAALTVAAVVLVPILGRNAVVETWPDSAKVYQVVGLATVTPGTGLDVKVTPLRSDGAFVVTGEITNTSQQPVSVPPVRVALLDTTKNEVEFQIIDPPVGSLPAGAIARFKTVFEHPSVAATDVVASFGVD
ncbi:MAG TPA: zinc-ribbon domain-containing protein [Stellaceae bacterium]